MATTTFDAATPASREEFVRKLHDDLVYRRVSSGLSYIETHRDVLDRLDGATAGAAACLSTLARWVDTGYGSPEDVRRLLERFPEALRPKLPLWEYLQVRLAEAFVAMSDENPEEAVRHLDFMLAAGNEAGDRELIALAHFWKGRCRRYQADYDAALECTIRGRDIANEFGYVAMAAVMRTLESWLYFQKGKYKESVRTLEEAEAVLLATDDYVTLGNIQSAYGRLARREGRHDAALERFGRAIEWYKKRDAQHRNYARTLANIAIVKRLIALQIRRRVDTAVTRRREDGPPRAANGARNEEAAAEASYRRRFEELRQESLAHLAEAGGIYRLLHHHRGTGMVHIDRGYLFLDGGEIDQACAEAGEAYELGQQKRDYILMSRARILQCMAEHSKLEEGIEEGSHPGRHAQLAREYAMDAVEAAKHTQNRWLLARAHTWEGLTLCLPYFQAREAASQCSSLASALLKPDDYDYLWDELQALKTKLLGAGGLDATLRAWSQGEVGDKTFRQISDEFAELIIPKIWEREDRKIARVASRLSISPKKVRRILHKVGLLNDRGGRA